MEKKVNEVDEAEKEATEVKVDFTERSSLKITNSRPPLMRRTRR